MNKISLLLVLAILIACNPKPKTHKEQVSYAIGSQFGRSLKSQNLDLDGKALANGITDALKGEGKLKLSDEEIQAAILKLNEDRQKAARAEAEGNKVKSDAFLEKNKTAEGVKIAASGLQYKIADPGTGVSPKGDDVVSVNYKGTLIDGTEFDSSYKRNQPAEFPLRGVIPGWTEGLQLLKKGGKATFYVPPELGYGDRQRQNIPANSTLIFEVELIDVKPNKTGAGGAKILPHRPGETVPPPGAK